MSLNRRPYDLTVGLFVAAGALCSSFALGRPSDGFAPFVPEPLPQRATGDFDGDGRPDVARIQDGDDGPGHISIRLSGSSATVRLDATVGALIDEDIDHDGDLDLVAATASGDVLIWLNDGHGRFTRQEPTRSQGFATDSVVDNPESNEPVAVSVSASFIAPGNGAETDVVALRARPPTAPRVFNLSFLLPQALRAPPYVAV